MSVERISFSVPLDDEGFLELKCPYCGDTFKLDHDDFKDESTIQIFCPHCGLTDAPGPFVMETDAGIHAQQLAQNYAMDIMNKAIKDLERSTQGNSFFKVKITKSFEPERPKTLIAINELVLVSLPCCEKTIKTFSPSTGVYCPFCGVKQNAAR